MLRRVARLLVGLLAVSALPGCLGALEDAPVAAVVPDHRLSELRNILVQDTLRFRPSVFTLAVGVAMGLYEPTVDVSDAGTLYVAGHVIGAGAT